jgi:CheY-like chemotaxis protein
MAILNNLDLEFDEVENGKEAIDALLEKNYNLVLMDIEMPVMNGLETTRYIRENLPFQKTRSLLLPSLHIIHNYFLKISRMSVSTNC